MTDATTIDVKETKHLPYLDSIRGIAALLVVLGHCWYLKINYIGHITLIKAFASPSNFANSVFERLFSVGRASVIIFFVLSGFVLALSLQKHPISFSNYLIRRFFRLYPALLVAILVSYTLHSLIGVGHDTGSDWLRREIINPILSYAVLFKHILMIGTKEGTSLDGVLWSLVHEIRISIIFPFLLMGLIRYGWKYLLLLMLISFSCTLGMYNFKHAIIRGATDASVFDTFITTLFFIIFFASGAYLVLCRHKITHIVENVHNLLKAFALAIALYLIFKAEDTQHTYLSLFTDYLHGIGALILIVLALSWSALQKILNQKIFLWLGKISYSLYLIHIPILYAVTQTFAFDWQWSMTSLTIIILSLVAADLMARVVEVPLTRFGKRLSAALEKPSNQVQTRAGI